MAWENAERVQVNSAGQYRALINGQWVPVSRAQKNSAGQYRVDRGAAPAEDTEDTEKMTGLTGAAMRGAERQISATRTALGSIFGSPEEAAAAGQERGEKIAEKYEEGPSLERIKQVYQEKGFLPAAKQVISDVPEAIAEQAPGIAVSLGSARAGIALGAATGNPYAMAGLGFLGLVAPSVLEQIGSSVERQAEEGVDDISMGRAVTAGTVGGAADALAQAVPLGKTVLRKLLGPEIDKVLSEGGQEAAEQLAKESLAATAAKGTAVGIVAEVPTEVGQQMLERWSAQLPLTDADAIREYLEVGYQAGLLGPLGGAGRVIDKSAAQAKISETPDEEPTDEPSPKTEPGADVTPATATSQETTPEVVTEEAKPAKPDDIAAAAIRELGDETEPLQYRKLVEEVTGLNPMQAGSLLARLTRKGVITAPSDTNLRTLGEAAPEVAAPPAPDVDTLLGDIEVIQPPVEDKKATEEFKATVTKIKEAKAPATKTKAVPVEAAPRVEAVEPEVVSYEDLERQQIEAATKGLTVEGEEARTETPAAVVTEVKDVRGDKLVTPTVKRGGRGAGDALAVSGGRAGTVDTATGNTVTSRVGSTATTAKQPVSRKGPEDPALSTDPAVVEKTVADTPAERYESVLARVNALRNTGRMKPDVANRIRETLKTQGNPSIPNLNYEPILSQAEQIVSKAEDWATEVEKGDTQAFDRNLTPNQRLDLKNRLLQDQERVARERAANEQKREEAVASLKALRGRTKQYDEPAYVGELRQTLENNDVNTAVKLLARPGAVNDQPKKFRPIYKAVADKIKTLDFSNVKIETENTPNANLDYFKKLRDDGKLAEFDPRTNTIRLQSDRLESGTVMHELVHAATVKNIRQYEVDPSKLTDDQRVGVQRLLDLLVFTRDQKIDPTLATEYSAAFESPYEFVAVAMTSPGFQHRLAKLSYTQEASVKNAWTDFVLAVAKVFGVRIKRADNFTALDEAGEAFSQILAAPTETVEGVAPLAARKRKKAEEKPPKPKKDLEEEIRKELEAASVNKFDMVGWFKYRTSKEGANKLVEDYQNAQRSAYVLQTEMDRANLTIYAGKDMNALSSALDRSAGRLRNNENVLLPYFQASDKAVNAYAAKTGKTVEEALAKLSKYFTAETVDQRRITNFIKEKPLKTTKQLRIKGIDQPISYAQYRDMLIDSVLTNKELTDAQREAVYNKLLDLTVNDTENKYADELGDSYGKLTKTGEARKPGVRPLNITDDYYNIISDFSDSDIKNTLEEMADEMQTNGAEIKAVRQALLDIHKMEQKFNEEAGFLSQPAKNLIKLYGWDKYVPLVGKMKKEVEEYENSVYRNSIPNEIIPGFRGRENVGNNAILMSRINAGKAAARAANKDVTTSLVNLIKPHPRTKESYVEGELVETIPFKDQYTGEAKFRMAAEGPESQRRYFYQRLDNGDLAIWRVDNKKIVDALRPEFDPPGGLRRGLQAITNVVAQGYTRYQIKFPPFDFVRSWSFNSGAIQSAFGAEARNDYFMDVASAVFKQFRLPQTWKISRLHSVGDFDGIKKLGGYNPKTGKWKDPFIRGAYEFLERGGKTTVVQTWQSQRRLQRELESLKKSKGRKAARATKDFIDGYFDAWIDTFDLVARVVAYNTAKSVAVNTRGMNEDAAQNFAASFAKNTANFENRGASRVAKNLSAIYAFFAPAATGAVRTLDALAPAINKSLGRVDEMIDALPPQIKNDPQAVEAYRKRYDAEAEGGKGAMKVFFGLGVFNFMVSFSLGALAISAVSGDEEEEKKKNAVAEDDMELWTRNLRLPLNWIMEEKEGKERFLQIPWGFGFGSFAAAGAQMAAVTVGVQSAPQAAANIGIIGLDSFMPLPVARYNPVGNWGIWALDTLMPTPAKGIFEYAVNMDGLGRQIYRDYHNRYGPAYATSASTPEVFNVTAQLIADATNQAWAPQPNELKFLMSNYADGVASLVSDAYDLTDYYVRSRRDFDPKKDLLILDNFFGVKIDKDVSNYQEARQRLEKFTERYTNAKNSPREGAISRFIETYPNAGGINARYNSLLNDLNRYEQNRGRRLSRAESPRERQQIEDDMRKTRKLQMGRIADLYEQHKEEIDNLYSYPF